MGYWDYYGGPEEAIIGIHSPYSLLRRREKRPQADSPLPKYTHDNTLNICSMVLYNIYLLQPTILGGPFDLVSRVSKVGYGDYKRVSRGY